MKSRIFKIALLVFLLYSNNILADDNYRLTVYVKGITTIKGDLYIAIYLGEENFQKQTVAATRVKVRHSSESISFDLPKGEYAITLYQDLNNNGRLDKLFSVPVEPYGISNNGDGFPSYDATKFIFNKNMYLNIQLKN